MCWCPDRNYFWWISDLKRFDRYCSWLEAKQRKTNVHILSWMRNLNVCNTGVNNIILGWGLIDYPSLNIGDTHASREGGTEGLVNDYPSQTILTTL